MTLYYSGLDDAAAIMRGIEWDAKVVERPVDESRQRTGGVRTSATAPRPHRRRGAGAPPAEQADAARPRAAGESLRRLSLAERLHHIALLRGVILRRREEIVDRIQRDTGKSRSDALISEIFGVLDNLAWLEAHARQGARRSQAAHAAGADGQDVVDLVRAARHDPRSSRRGTIPSTRRSCPSPAPSPPATRVVYKPSEWTPLEGLIEDLLAEAQFAPNWVQVVYGDGAVGAALVEQRPGQDLLHRQHAHRAQDPGAGGAEARFRSSSSSAARTR